MSEDGSSERSAARSAAGRYAYLALNAIDRAVAAGVIAAMAVLVVIVSTQVILRYFFNTSLDWAWEASRLGFVTAVFLGMPLALKEHGHVGIDIVQVWLRPRIRRVLLVVLNAIGIFLMMVVAVIGSQATIYTWDQTLPSLPISSGWFYVPVIWSGIHCSLHFVAQGVEWARGGDLPATLPEELLVTPRE